MNVYCLICPRTKSFLINVNFTFREYSNSRLRIIITKLSHCFCEISCSFILLTRHTWPWKNLCGIMSSKYTHQLTFMYPNKQNYVALSAKLNSLGGHNYNFTHNKKAN